MRLVADRALRTARPVRRPAADRRAPGAQARSRVGPLVLLAVVIAATAAGAWALADRLFSSSPSATAQASLSGLTATVEPAGWVGMDMQHTMGTGGFQMPAQMMPGAPEGDNMRLGIPVTLYNTAGTVQTFNLTEEFSLTGGLATEPVRVHSDTIGALNRLAPGSAVSGVLYFDLIVPGPEDPPLMLHWARDGESTDILVPMMGGGVQHGH